MTNQNTNNSSQQQPADAPAVSREDDSNKKTTLARSNIGLAAKTVVIALTLTGISLSVYQLFNLGKYAITLLQGQYLYLLAGLFLAQVFLCFRLRHSSASIPPWYDWVCLLYTSPSPRDKRQSRMPSSA